MTLPATPAERIDAIVSALLEGVPRAAGDLGEVARLVHAALPPMPPSAEFDRRLRARLWRPRAAPRLVDRVAVARRELGRTGLIAAGALSSAAVGFTALALWHGMRRQPAGRLLHR